MPLAWTDMLMELRRSELLVAAPEQGPAPTALSADSRAVTTMAEIEALSPKLHDLKSGPRFANVKIDGANVERILPMRDGTFIVNRIRGSLGFPPL